jgi:predicted Zn-dependent protease
MGTTTVCGYHSTMRFLYLLALLVCLLPRAVAEGLPDLGEASQAALSPQQEQALGHAIMRDVRADATYLDDPEVSEYLNNLGYRLVANSPDNRRDFNFFVIRDNTLNAFALPGGYIGVHTGLILAAQSESELAGVLAHEIAHVTQHHLARMIARQNRSTLTSLAALAVAILAARSNPEVANAAIATVQATSIQNQLDFTRDNEREADRIGIQILQQAGFDPRAMATFFERLQKFNRLYENNAPAYLRTHPLTTERIADMQNRVANLPYRQVPDSLDFQLVRAKLRATQGQPDKSVAFFEGELQDHKYLNETATRYGLAYVLYRSHALARAEQEVTVISKSGGSHPMIENLSAQILAENGKVAQAIEQYRQSLRKFPDNRPLLYGFVHTLLLAHRTEEALELLKDRLQVYPDDRRLYELEGRAYALQGKQLLQHQALAEAQVRLGNFPAAIEQLQIALRSGDGDFYQLSSVEARLRELRALDAAQRKQR